MKNFKDIVEAKGPHDADFVEKSARHERLYAYHKRMGNEAEAAKHKAEIDKLYKREDVALDESHVEFRLDHREKTSGDVNSTLKDHEAKVSDQTDKATYIKVPKHKADSFKSTMKSKHGAKVELDEEVELDEATPYYNKPSFLKKMGRVAKQERLAREKKEAEQKQVKEATVDTADIEKNKLISNKDKNTLSKLSALMAKEKKPIKEVLDPSMGAGEYVTDFQKSDAPQFKGKSKEKRRQMAIAAYLDAKRQVKEGVIQSSGTDKIDVAGNTVPVAPVPDRKYIKGTPEWKAHKEKNKSRTGHPTNVKEETMQEQAPVAPVPPKSGYVVKYHTKDGEHKNTSKLFQNKTLADIHANKGNGMDKVGGKYTVHKIALKEETIEEGRNEGDTPFDKPYKTVTNKDTNVKDKSGAVHTPMSRAKDLARKAMKAQMREQFDIDITDEQADSLIEAANLEEGKMKDIATNRSEDNRLNVPKKNTDVADKSWLKDAGKKPSIKSDLKNLGRFLTGKKETNEEIDLETGDLVESKVSYSEFVAQLNEYESKDGRYVHTKGSYGKAYQDPEGADDADDKKPSTKGRKVGSKSGPRKILGTSKLHK